MGARVTAGPKRRHLSVCPGPNFPLQGRQGSRNDMMHCVNVAVSHVHPDGSDGETIVLPQTVDHNGLVWTGRSS